jgi:hypothetical protein
MGPVTVFLAMAAKGLVLGTIAVVLGREPFAANPKGPLYKWFGKTNHEKRRELLQTRLRDQEQERISSRLDRRPVRSGSAF